jgi:hypothetical protein
MSDPYLAGNKVCELAALHMVTAHSDQLAACEFVACRDSGWGSLLLRASADLIDEA